VLDETTLEHDLIKVNGITLHVVSAGPKDGPPVILLHGFPEFWYGWKHQIPALVEAGYRVIVPDQRGYNQSDKPAEVRDYAITTLADDILGLMDKLGHAQVKLIGHDWGGMVAWWLAITHPERIEKLGILNIPHPAVFSRTLRSDFRQMLKSWYVFAIQIPWLPETMLGGRNASGLADALKRSGKPDTFSDADMVRYREAWGRTGTVKAMLNWYRAYVRYPAAKPASVRLKMPVQMIWGKEDIALSAEMAQPSIDLCENGNLTFIEGATHWVQHDAPDQVNTILLNFLAQ
jgi:pimeloyl-ACP methyl ester carboxylesterase